MPSRNNNKKPSRTSNTARSTIRSNARSYHSSKIKKHTITRSLNRQAQLRTEAERCKKFIYNYTDTPLSDIEIIALSKGFKFIPTPSKPSRNQILKDFSRMARGMRINYLMRNRFSKKHMFKLPSEWEPETSGNTYLEEYLDETHLELSNIRFIKPKPNLSNAEKIALTNLSKNKSIVIKPLDKGKATAIVSRSQYCAEAHRQLSAFHYEKIDHDWTPKTSTMVDALVEDLFSEGYIDKHARKYLITKSNNVQVPVLYLLVKAHKPKPETTEFAGRPIISGCNAPTRALSEYLDYFLLPIVQS